MAIAAIGRALHPDLAPPRNICELLTRVIEKVITVVSQALNTFISFVLCIPKKYIPEFRFRNFIPMPEIAAPTLVDSPVDLEKLRSAINNSENTDISMLMTPGDFLTLIKEFPHEQQRIGKWAETWAADRTLQVDPSHPYFEIFQEAFRLKNQIDDGYWSSGDYRTYRTRDENYYASRQRFGYIIHSLSGFQEFTRPENRELLLLLDDKSETFMNNPAYKFARALSKIYAYPKAGGGDRDVQAKLHTCLDSAWEAYQLAKANGQTLRYFQEAFKDPDFGSNPYCFDARIMALQVFSQSIVAGSTFDLYNVNLKPTDTIDRKIGEYYRVFRNRQIAEICRDRHLDIKNMTDSINGGTDNVDTQRFYQNYCTKGRFAAYLVQMGNPIQGDDKKPIAQARWEQLLSDEYWTV